MAHDMFMAKLRASTELDNLLDASRYIAHKEDDGHHPDATGGWDYFSTLFRVNGQMYRGRINIMITDDGPVFYDVTHISRTQKGTTESIFGDTRPRAASPKSPLGGVRENISQELPEVKDVSLPKVEDRQMSVTEQEDTDYMAAVNRGDTETAQRMVDEAAERTGYTIKAYHGTLANDFTVFRKDLVGSRYSFDERGFFFSSSKRIANDYASSEFDADRKGRTIEAYLRIDSPLVVDGNYLRREGYGNLFRNQDAIEVWDGYSQEFLDDAEMRRADGIILDDGNTKMFVVMDGEQIKSADPVTYDDNGDVISLSERFNRENQDIRWSATEEEDYSLKLPMVQQNQTETENFKRWFGDWQNDPQNASEVVNADGTPKVMYRGDASDFTVFDRKKSKSSNLYGRGFYFTDSEAHAKQYGKTRAFYLDVKKPLSPGQHEISRSQMRAFLEAVAENEDDYDLQNYGYGATADSVLSEVYGKGDFEMLQDVSATAIGDFVEAVELFNQVNGTDYDGIITDTETVTFRSEQAKSATDNAGTFDRRNPDIRYSTTEEEVKGLELPRVEDETDGKRIYRDAPEEYRYKVLKDKTLTVKSYDQSKLGDVDLSRFDTLTRNETKILLRKIGEQFGVFKTYSNKDIEVEFNFSRNNLNESIHKQRGRYGDYAKMLTVFDDVVRNAIGIEAHSERYANPGSQLEQMYVLTSAFKTEDGVVPVLMEVKELSDRTENALHLTISLNPIREADIVTYTHAPEKGTMSYAPSASEYRIADVFQNVNTEDSDMLKYIPDGFLTDEQREAKQAALARTEQYIQEKNRRYQSSRTEEEVRGLELPYVESVGQERTGSDTEAPEVKDMSLPKVEQTDQAETRKKPKPVAESKPIEAKRWLNRQIMDSFGIRENKTEASNIIRKYADFAFFREKSSRGAVLCRGSACGRMMVVPCAPGSRALRRYSVTAQPLTAPATKLSWIFLLRKM